MLDIPCGTGAGSCGLVATLIELRASNVMPRLPLSLSVLGGDFAERAREICGQMLADLEQPALAEGIRLRFSVAEWNATQTDVTAKLVDEWFAQSQDAEEFVVLVSNFSGHLKNAATFSDFSPCLEHVLARLHGKRATLLCIEPEMKQAESVFQRLKQFFSTLLDRFRVPWGNQPASKVARYQMSHPVSRQVHRSSVIVQSFTRR